jgi:hypothetical protein
MRAQRSHLTALGLLLAASLGGAASHFLFDGATARAEGPAPAVPAAAAEGQVMHAYGFVVVDEHGNELARLGTSANGQPALTVLDAKGKVRLRVGALEGPVEHGLRAYNAEGRNIIDIGASAEGAGDLTLDRPDGREVWRATRSARGAAPALQALP